ncbi:hypothetical protein ACSBR1_012948 [Camellia fascicularis]
MLHLYSCDGENKVQPHLVIEAHIGSVNDLAFASTSENLSIVTDGVDKLLRCGMWLLVPICLLLKGMRLLYFVFALMSWKIFIPLVHCDASGGVGCTIILYSIDDKRLFSCGTNQNGETRPVEWIENREWDQRSSKDVPKTIEVIKPTKTLKIKEIRGLAQLQSLPFLGSVKMAKIFKLTYTSSSNTILAIASNAIHLLWSLS